MSRSRSRRSRPRSLARPQIAPATHDRGDAVHRVHLRGERIDLGQAGIECLAARRRVIEIVRAARRRPQLVEPVDVEGPDTVVDVIDARDRLRTVMAAARTENERAALARVLRGEPITRSEKALQIALWRLRRRLAA